MITPMRISSRCALAALLTLITAWSAIAQQERAAPAQPAAAPDDVSELLETIRTEHNLPALSGAVVRGGELIAIGASGVRKARNDAPVRMDDRFHLGSCTKSMTATLAAILIEDDELTWETTITEALPELAADIRVEYRDVTLRMLLAHRGGLPEDRAPAPDLWPRIVRLDGEITQQRRTASLLALNQHPEAKPGERMIYSNFGYVVAGAMMEAITGKTWEDLMRERLFEPLGMTSAGFGAPGAGEPLDINEPAHPWGHLGEASNPAAIRPGIRGDNPPVLGPAGTVHCSMADWAKYISFHLTRGEGSDLLSAESFEALHSSAFDGEYAMGWVVAPRAWAGGDVLTHAGSNGMWYAVTWIAPKRNVAFIAACNFGGDGAAAACDDAVAALIDQFLDPPGPSL